MHTREPFEKAYKVYHVLGKGGFGIVYAGVRNQDGLQVAIKHIAKAKIKDWGQVSYFLVFTFFLVNIHHDIPTDIALDKYIFNTLSNLRFSVSYMISVFQKLLHIVLILLHIFKQLIFKYIRRARFRDFL